MAFKYSESSYGHWLPLMIADRIGMIEGIIDDIRHGHFPNLFKERGLKADWEYNKNGFFRKVAIAGILSAAIITIIAPKKKKKKFHLL